MAADEDALRLGCLAVPIGAATERVRHVVQNAFNGRRIVIFSGCGQVEDAPFLEEVRAIQEGCGFRSIIGRNAFQRSKQDALKLSREIVDH